MTGGTGALGGAVIQALRARGDEVICLDLRAPSRSDSEFVEVDVTDRLSVNQAIRTAAKMLGGIDALVHAAGIIETAPFCELDETDFQRILDVNLLGTFRIAQETSRYMCKRGGRIVLVSSIHGQIGVPGRSAYAAAKGGIASLARVMAAELAQHRVRVNVLAPGAVNGGMLGNGRSRQGWVTATPIKRLAYLEEVAGVAALLTSENASFVTGQIVPVDGGVSTVRAFS